MRIELRELEPETNTFGQPKYKPDGTLYPGYKQREYKASSWLIF